MKEEVVQLIYRNTKDHTRLLWTSIRQQRGQPKEMNKFLETYNLTRLNHDE